MPNQRQKPLESLKEQFILPLSPKNFSEIFTCKVLSLMNFILDMKEAKIEDGGSGAFYIYLKKNKK